MKKLLIVSLVTAIGAAAMISQASATSRYCFENPDDPRCFEPGGDGYPPPPPPRYGDDGYPPPPPPPRFGDGDYPPPPPRPHRPHRRHYFDDGFDDNADGPIYDQGPVFSFQFGSPSRGSCSEIGSSLRRNGFRRVQAVDCAGREFAFVGFRDGQRLRITVGSSDGRIHHIRPY
jgi:hypothetical protein